MGHTRADLSRVATDAHFCLPREQPGGVTRHSASVIIEQASAVAYTAGLMRATNTSVTAILMATLSIACGGPTPAPVPPHSVPSSSASHVPDDDIEAVLIHPPYEEYFMCGEHYDGQFKTMGDALGADCVIHRLVSRNGRSWASPYKTDGLANSDWFGWEKNVLAPFDGKVIRTNVNSAVNEAGVLGKGIASFVVVERADGPKVLLAHVTQLRVKEGDVVRAGQVIALVGNNGQSRHPHVHLAAWKGSKAFQIRVDQRKLGKVVSE